MFTHLTLYRFDPVDLQFNRLLDALPMVTARPCGPFEPMTRGWAAPTDSGALLEVVGQHWLLALDTDEKILPASVIKAEVKKRATALEKETGAPLGRKARKELAERIKEELLGRAITRQRRTHVWIDPQGGWFGIDTATPGQADAVIETLRLCLDAMPLKPIRTAVSPQSAMADWLADANSCPNEFGIDRDVQLQSPEEGKTTVTYKNHPLEGMTEIRDQLAKGLLPTRLALTWNERLAFQLTDRHPLTLRRLSLLDIAATPADETDAADQRSALAADFAIFAGETARLLPDLIAALGGLVPDHESD